MKLNDYVYKEGGYEFDGKIVAEFENTQGSTRFVVEHADSGMLHIFNGSQLARAGDNFGKEIEWRINNRGALSDRIGYMVKELMNDG